jgi:hypothetical protein
MWRREASNRGITTNHGIALANRCFGAADLLCFHASRRASAVV